MFYSPCIKALQSFVLKIDFAGSIKPFFFITFIEITLYSESSVLYTNVHVLFENF